MQFAREMDAELADKFVACTWNKWTLGYGRKKGRQAVKRADQRAPKPDCCGPAYCRILSEE